MNRFSWIIVFWFMGILGCIHAPLVAATPPPSIPHCPSSARESKGDWSRFRAAYPYHIQGLALSEPSSSGHRTLIVAEPPPGVTLAAVKAVDVDLLGDACVEQHGVGYDGWTRDIVVPLPALDADRLADLSGALNQLLFHSTYKAYVLDIPSAPPSTPLRGRLELHVSAAEIHQWLVARGERLTPADGGPATGAAQLLNAPARGVYFGETPGIVIWAIPRDRPFEDVADDARQFALESDLVIGALGSPGTVLVIGRERQIGVDVVPPLRAESLALLASVRKEELAQSYERQSFLAGKLADGRDWAPIYLSPELIDTEYGSLLNITDQILKSWSNNGATRYQNFAYPDPPAWAFAGPLAKVINADSLTYNWNTHGYGSSFDLGGYDLVAFRGTGALPVTYIADQKSTDAYEAQAYRFFNEANDPNLVRVVQYAEMYQIFQRFALPARTRPQTTSAEAHHRIMTDAAGAMLRALKEASPERLASAARSALAGELTDLPEEQQKLALGNVALLLSSMQARLRTLGDPALDELASGLLKTSETREDRNRRLTELLAPELLDAKEIVPALLRQFMDTDVLLQRYVAAVPPRQGSWIHTPALVISWNTGAMHESTGGHNLDAHVSRFRSTPGVAPGDIRVVEEGGVKVALYHPNNFDDLSHIMHEGGVAANGARPPPPRSPSTALALSTEPIPPGKRGLWVAPGQKVRSEMGWEWTGERPVADDAVLLRDHAAAREPAIVITRAERGYQVAIAEGKYTFEASTAPDLRRALEASMGGARPGAPTKLVVFKGVPFDSANAIMKSMQGSAGGAPELMGIVGNPGRDGTLSQLFKAPCNMAQAEISASRVEMLPGGAQKVSLEVRIPLGTATGGQASIRPFVMLKNATAAARQRISDMVQTVVNGRLGRPASVEQVSRDLQRELLQVAPGQVDSVLIQVDEAQDLHIIIREPTDGSDRTARNDE